jgi:hypothetical protein
MAKAESFVGRKARDLLLPSPSLSLQKATPAAREDGPADGHWLEVSRRMRFTFASVFLGSVNFRCMMLSRPLGQPPYPLTPSLFDLLPRGVRAVHICSQSISSKLPRVSLLGRGISYVPLQGKRFFVDLNGSFDSFMGKFRAKTRETIRRKIRRFTEASGNRVLWREFSDSRDAIEFHSLASEVSRKTYQHRLLRAGIDPSSSFGQQLVRMAIDNELRGYVLFCREIPVAYMLCQTRYTDLVLENTGFDPSFAADSPGLVLLCLVLEQLFARKEFSRFDFGEGAYSYKEQMATGSIEAAEIYYFPINLANAALVAVHSGVEIAASFLRSTLRALGLLQGLKKMVRQNMIRHGIMHGGVARTRTK